MAVYWNGTQQEASELLHAISSHCSCNGSTDAHDATGAVHGAASGRSLLPRATPPEPAKGDAATTGDARAGRCAPHRMLVEDQRAVNGLLFGRKIMGRLLLEEWDLTATGWADATPRARLPLPQPPTA